MMQLNQLSRRCFANRAATQRYLMVTLRPFLQGALTEYGTKQVTLVYREQSRARLVRKRATGSQTYAEVMALLSSTNGGVRRIGLKAGNQYGAIHLMADTPLVGIDVVYGIEV